MRFALVLAIAACGGSKEQAPKADRVVVDPIATATAPPVLSFVVAPPRDKIVGVGHSEHFGCVVRASGGVDCWGQMGAGRPEPRPRRIPGVTDAKAITRDGTCVLRATDEIACLASDRLELVTTPGPSGIAGLSSGASECFVMRDGGVTCNADGKRARVPEITDAVAVSEGDMNKLCVVRAAGEVVCGGRPERTDVPLRPLVGLPPVRAFSLVRNDTGNGACAILQSGAVTCFAINGGKPELVADLDRYSRAVTGFDEQQFAGATEISVEVEPDFKVGHAFILEAIVGGKVVRWDRHGTTTLPDLTDAVQLAAGCALRAQGSVVCWGSNAGGGLGQPTTIGRMMRPATTVVGLANVASLALGAADSWALTQDGHVFHWGRSAEGWATEVAVPAGVGRITALTATGGGSACALADAGAVWCWTPQAPVFTKQIESGVRSIAGSDRWLLAVQADLSITITELDPKPSDRADDHKPLPPPPADTVALVIRGWNECALLQGGEVACFAKSWVRIPGIARATDVIAGYTSCALRAGSLTCWDTSYDSDVIKPKPGPAMTDATAIASSDDEICAVRARGRVTCYRGYGYDAFDVLPAGAIAIELGTETVKAEYLSSRGGSYGCAIMRDHSVKCWGANLDGALGDGSVRASRRPLGVPGL